MKRSLLAIILVIPVLLCSALNAQWNSNPSLNTAVCTATSYQIATDMVSDGAGGVIVTWHDGRSGAADDIYAQRLNALGIPQWTTNGVAICTAVYNQSEPKIISDGAGGAIITWFDDRDGTDHDIYAQRINALGVVQWTTDGTPICLAPYIQTTNSNNYRPSLVTDGAGGAIITWADNRSNVTYDMYAQRINALGVVQWATDGVVVCAHVGNQVSPVVCAGSAGGAIVTWYDTRSGNPDWDIYAQYIDASGAIQWGAAGVPICVMPGSQFGHTIVPDGASGAIISWEDDRNGPPDVYSQRISAAGVPLWTLDGVAVCTEVDIQETPTSIADGTGGAIITWADHRTATINIYAQRINSSGTPQWTVDGAAVASNTDYQNLPTIVSDSMGGAIIAWIKDTIGVYAQRINASGIPQWPANGIAISTAPNVQIFPDIISDGAGGAIIGWHDLRNGNYDIYAQNINAQGTLEAINENNLETSISLYPNPANNFLTITLSENRAIQNVVIYDVNGKAVKTITPVSTDKNFKTDISALTPGIYFLMLQTDEMNYSKSFIVE